MFYKQGLREVSFSLYNQKIHNWIVDVSYNSWCLRFNFKLNIMVLKMMPEEKQWDDLLIFLGIWSLYTWPPNTPKHILQALWGSTTEGRPGLCCAHPSPTASEHQPFITWGTQEIIHRPAESERLIFNISKTKCKIMPSFYEVHGDCSEINEVLCLHYTRKLFNYIYLENTSVIYRNIARLAFLVLRSRSRVWTSLVHTGRASIHLGQVYRQIDLTPRSVCSMGPSGTPFNRTATCPSLLKTVSYSCSV